MAVSQCLLELQEGLLADVLCVGSVVCDAPGDVKHQIAVLFDRSVQRQRISLSISYELGDTGYNATERRMLYSIRSEFRPTSQPSC